MSDAQVVALIASQFKSSKADEAVHMAALLLVKAKAAWREQEAKEPARQCPHCGRALWLP